MHYLESNGSPTLLKVSERIAAKSWRTDRKNIFYSSKNFALRTTKHFQ